MTITLNNGAVEKWKCKSKVGWKQYRTSPPFSRQKQKTFKKKNKDKQTKKQTNHNPGLKTTKEETHSNKK